MMKASKSAASALTRANLSAIPAGMTPVEIGRMRLKEITTTGRGRAASVIQYVENLKPIDRVVRASNLKFDHDPAEDVNHLFVRHSSSGTSTSFYEKLHPFALHQATDKMGLPWSYAERLKGLKDARSTNNDYWGGRLLAHNLSALFAHSEDKILLRSIEGQIRAVLSDRFRRLDSGPLITAFAEACKEVKAIPYEGYVSDTKIGIQAIIAEVYEPIKDEIMAYGVSFENSDFGNGALNVSTFLLRLQSLSGMIGPDKLRKVHLGRRLDEDTSWSRETSELDLQTVCSGVKDLVKNSLAPERIEAMQLLIYESSLEAVNSDRGKLTLEMLKTYLTKAELDKAMTKFNDLDVVTLPAGNSLWRMSNAVSWLAGDEPDGERKLALQTVAGKVLVGGKKS